MSKERPFTKRELNILAWNYGSKEMWELEKILGRDAKDIRMAAKAHRIRPTRGITTIQDIVKKTGFSYEAVRHAAKRAGVIITRQYSYNDIGRRTNHLTRIADDSVPLILEELNRISPVRALPVKSGEWGYGKPEACLMCGTTETRHVGRGLCNKCYKKAEYAGFLHEYPILRRRRGTFKLEKKKASVAYKIKRRNGCKAASSVLSAVAPTSSFSTPRRELEVGTPTLTSAGDVTTSGTTARPGNRTGDSDPSTP